MEKNTVENNKFKKVIKESNLKLLVVFEFKMVGPPGLEPGTNTL